MKQFKLTFLITALMSIVSIRVSAYTCKIDGICYNLNSNNLTATVTYSGYPHNNEYTGAYGSSLAGKDVAIPSTISYNDEEYTVTAIGDKAFYDSESTVLMASITIPSTVTSIGSQAFWKCTNLTSITIPSSVTIIGSDAFYGCSGLTTIIIPNSVTSIGRSAFESTVWYNNKPDGMVYAGKVAYKYKGTMPDNTSIVIEEGTVSISPFAFHNCSGLTNVTIPNSVISIGETAFCGCSSLTSVNIPNNVTSIDKSTFSSCSSLTSVNIPNSVITISEGAFQNCSSLTSITIPNSVTTIGKSAFSGTGIYANSPNGVFYVDKWACGYKGSMPSNTTISLQEETVGVASYAFYNYSNLTSVSISNSVTSIGDYAFQNCTGLTSMIIPNSVTSIGIQAFYGCSGLTSVTMPGSVMSIGSSIFSGCI